MGNVILLGQRRIDRTQSIDRKLQMAARRAVLTDAAKTLSQNIISLGNLFANVEAIIDQIEDVGVRTESKRQMESMRVGLSGALLELQRVLSDVFSTEDPVALSEIGPSRPATPPGRR